MSLDLPIRYFEWSAPTAQFPPILAHLKLHGERPLSSDFADRNPISDIAVSANTSAVTRTFTIRSLD